MSVMEWIRYVAKAITAGVLAFGGLFTVAIVDGVVDTGEWVAIVVATVVAVLGVFLVPNSDKPVE